MSWLAIGTTVCWASIVLAYERVEHQSLPGAARNAVQRIGVGLNMRPEGGCR